MHSAPNSDYCGDNVPVLFFLYFGAGIFLPGLLFLSPSRDKRILPGTNSAIVPAEQHLVTLSCLKTFFRDNTSLFYWKCSGC